MMAETRIQYALDHFIAEKYFDAESEEYLLKEMSDSGKSELMIKLRHWGNTRYKCTGFKADKGVTYESANHSRTNK